MQVHGQSDFDVLATPVGLANDDNNGSVLYDTFPTFSDESTLYNYTLVDGMAFVTTSSNNRNGNVAPSVECAEQDMLPPINSIVSAINEATPVSSISSSSSGTIDCRSGDTFKVSVNGIDFGLCFMGSSGFTLHGSDLDITVKYTERIEMPTIDGGVCMKVEAATLVTAIGKSFLTGEPINSRDARRLRAALFNLDFSFGDEACSCKSTPRPCIFIHGLGVKKEEPENLDIFPTRYWGNLTQDDAPCCTSMKYAMLNTVNNSWTSDEQQQKVCDRALAVSETSQGSTITDTIIITHSMGNLMLAGAIAKGMCSLDSSVSWVGLSGPMRGSMDSNYFQDSCKNDTNFLAEDMAAKTGYCPADDGIISLAYEGESYSSPELDAAYAAAQKAYRSNVTALMCSNGFWGLRSERQWWYWVLGIVVPHKSSKNDGIVEFYSCAGGLPTSSFGNSYTDKFYVTKLNHADTAFRNGDALLNKAKMPVKWLECLL
ncbi:unnamed protein product [Phytophthora lilii]|uniref:Unnamed protein product n=1 Tax=Phytophthora lilii TaxID=2077276 RepID=A0A9W7CMD1_9STRA|nr:unnamed protein product [Phytophthora lilii]